MKGEAMMLISADLGGTKIRAAVFDRSLRTLFKTQVPSEASAGKTCVLSALEAVIGQCMAWCDEAVPHGRVAGIGISTAGVVEEKTGSIQDATDAIPGWKGTPLAAWLRARFACPVVVENDVKCALLGELNQSAELLSGRVAMLTLGTGLGGALAEQGKIVVGAHAVAGHFGRQPVPSPWRRGELLALESLVSGTGLTNLANREDGDMEFADGRAVLEHAVAGNDQALRGLDQFCNYLAMVLEQVYWVLDPDVILIGGGLVEARDLWWPRMIEKLAYRGLPIKIQPAKLDNDAGVHGAGKLILAHTKSGEIVDANA
uniref:ROK family protein n=1 Tax=Microbulbifer agarilyticus TaxID=260552 RepID=UPI0002558A75|nr:ROK family protein [Microbulbifer agarilyticus]